MTWAMIHKRAHDADLVELPKSLQRQATLTHAELEQDPVPPHGKRASRQSPGYRIVVVRAEDPDAGLNDLAARLGV